MLDHFGGVKEPKGTPSHSGSLHFTVPLSRVKDTFLAVIIGQAGQDSSQDSRGVGQHYPACQLDELPHPAHGCQLNQVVWKGELVASRGAGTCIGEFPPNTMHKV